jgi:hypothetical protein
VYIGDVIQDYYGQPHAWGKALPADTTPTTSPEPVMPHLLRASKLLWSEVMNTQKQFVGDIKDVVLKCRPGQD